MATINLAPEPGMYYQDQAFLNAIFANYRISFKNPELVVVRIIQLMGAGGYLAIPSNLNERGLNNFLRYSNLFRLWTLLHNIRDLTLHRHRIDALNIIAQVRIRMTGRPGREILRPMPVEPDYDGPDRQGPAVVAAADAQLIELQNIVQAGREGLLWQPGDPHPVPLRARTTPHELSRDVPRNNEDALELIMQDKIASETARDAIFNILSADPPPNLIIPPVLLDNPSEICLQMPEDCRFLNDPTPTSRRMVEILVQNANELLIWDYRIGDRREISPLGTEHYIYRLISLVRDIVRQPDTARAYAIIFRAYPIRYTAGSADEIVDEIAPTAAESR